MNSSSRCTRAGCAGAGRGDCERPRAGQGGWLPALASSRHGKWRARTQLTRRRSETARLPWRAGAGAARCTCTPATASLWRTSMLLGTLSTFFLRRATTGGGGRGRGGRGVDGSKTLGSRGRKRTAGEPAPPAVLEPRASAGRPTCPQRHSQAAQSPPLPKARCSPFSNQLVRRRHPVFDCKAAGERGTGSRWRVRTAAHANKDACLCTAAGSAARTC